MARPCRHARGLHPPAVPADNRVLSSFREGGFEVIKRAALLGKITHDSDGICVAGSHGKTTVSSMAGLILAPRPHGMQRVPRRDTPQHRQQPAALPGSRFSVIEADEYDRSFHHLSPFIAVVTSTDPDHLDIYGNEENYLDAFAHFTSLIRPGGTLILHTGLKMRPRVQKGVGILTYSAGDPEADFHAENARYEDGRLLFDLKTPENTIRDVEVGVPVEINIDNAVAAAAAALTAGATPEEVKSGLAAFMGGKTAVRVLAAS